MESYKSALDGHAISCKPFSKKLESLIKLPIQGSKNAHSTMPKAKAVKVNDVTRIFTLDQKKFEYYNNGQSLTEYLLSFKQNTKVVII